MTADLRSTVNGMTRGLAADLDHMTDDALDGMEDIAAGRLRDPDQHISLPPSIVAMVTGTDVDAIVAARTPQLATPPAQPPLPALGIRPDILAERERLLEETKKNIASTRRQFGLDDPDS